MRPLLLDTNAYSAFKCGDKNIVEVIRHVESIVISPIVLGELYAGFDSGNKSAKNRDELHQFLNSSRVSVFPLTQDTANIYAQIYTRLKKKAKPIPTNDMWISSQALENGCFVCTFDKHFEEIDGIIIVNTISDL